MQATTLIRAPIDRVYAFAKDVEAFPQFMPDLEAVKVLERRNGDTVTEWVGIVQGRKIRWVEEDRWDDARHVCTFHLREGDFSKYEGIWEFAPVEGGTQTTVAVDFELDLPLAGALLSNLLKVLVRKNMESMLAAIKGQLDGQAGAGE
ncbi:MAG TPA: SRPBCC family protein [bacterium]